MSELDELLKRLSDVSTKTTVVGLAIGKTKDQLHLAIRDGVIAIPLSEISDVRRLDMLRPDSEMVEVDVEHPETIVRVRRVRRITPGAVDGAAPMYEFGSPSTSTLTGELTTETATLTGRPGEHDMTDDGPGSPIPDDSIAPEFEGTWY